MADISLPSPGQKPWSLNPAIEAINSEVEATTDIITNGRLSSSGITSVANAASANPDDIGYDLVLLMGQSNMAGRGSPADPILDVQDRRIRSFGNSGGYSNRIALASEPLANHEASSGVGPGLAFARRYVSGVPINRSVLLVPVAHGDTGFQTVSASAGPNQRVSGVTGGGTWRPTGSGINLYQNAVTQAKAALAAAGPGARIVAALWVQGEADSTNGSVLTQAQYSAALDELITTLRTDLSLPELPFIVGSLTAEWIAEAVTSAAPGYPAQINAAHIDTPRRLTRTAFVYGPGAGNSNSPTDLVHYNANAQRVIGGNLHRGYLSALGNTLGSNPVAPQNVSLSQSGTTVTVSWESAIGRSTDYVVQYLVNGGSWTTVTHSASVALSTTLSGLLSGQSVTARVATVNEQGTSAFTTSPTLNLAYLPNSITSLSAGTPTGSTIPLSWTAPVVDSSHSAATGYTVEYKLTSSSTWTIFGTVTGVSATLIGLIPSSAYDYRVTATNARGSASAVQGGPTSTSGIAPLVDEVGVSAFRAVSVSRRLRAAYAGAAFKVRRSSDNTTQDIGFDSNGNVDTAAALAFVGSGSGYIATIFDQSGNARDLTQATAASQPMIVNAGTLVTLNGKPSMTFDGTDDMVFSTTGIGLYSAGSATSISVAKGTTSATGVIVAEGSASAAAARYLMEYVTSAGVLGQQTRTDTSTNLTSVTGSGHDNATPHVSTMVDTGTALTLRVDGKQVASQASYARSGNVTLDRTSIGGSVQGTPTLFFGGQIGEVVSWSTALNDTQRVAAEANAKAYHGTP